MEADIMNEEQISQTLLDQMVSSDRGQMIKAAIPYLPPKGQQIFSVYEKAVEFINTVSVFNKRSSGSDLCAMSKGALNLEAKAAGCNKIAYAHHKDDIIETMLLSLMFEGRFYTFPPKTFLDRTELTVIRPLMYVSEADVIGFKNKYNLPVCKNPCPADGHTKREYVKNLTRQLNKDNPGIKERLFHAVTSGNIEGWNSGNIGMAGTSEEVADKTCRSETSVKMQSDQTGAEEQLSESHNCHENDRESKNKKEEF